MFKQLWTEVTFTFKGLPRPFAIPNSTARSRIKGVLAKKVPIPWQSFSRLHEGRALGVIKKHEAEVWNNNVCAYCGLNFKDKELAIIWTAYPDKNKFIEQTRVFSDYLPFHIQCMKETRIFCPHMKLTKNDEFKIGTYEDVLKESKSYLLNNFILE